MKTQQIDICEKLFAIAAEQYSEGKIDKDEYRQTLLMIRKKVKEIKIGFNELDFISMSLSKPILEVNIVDTINFVLAVN